MSVIRELGHPEQLPCNSTFTTPFSKDINLIDGVDYFIKCLSKNKSRQYFFVFESTKINTLLYLFLDMNLLINDDF